MEFYGEVAYHHYEGVALDLDEQQRLVADLEDKNVMIWGEQSSRSPLIVQVLAGIGGSLADG